MTGPHPPIVVEPISRRVLVSLAVKVYCMNFQALPKFWLPGLVYEFGFVVVDTLESMETLYIKFMVMPPEALTNPL
jgi:hypothetical protein